MAAHSWGLKSDLGLQRYAELQQYAEALADWIMTAEETAIVEHLARYRPESLERLREAINKSLIPDDAPESDEEFVVYEDAEVCAVWVPKCRMHDIKCARCDGVLIVTEHVARKLIMESPQLILREQYKLRCPKCERKYRAVSAGSDLCAKRSG